MTDDDGAPETGWTGWQRVVVLAISAGICIAALLIVLFVFTDEEPAPVPPAAPATAPSTVVSTTTTGA